MRAPRGSTDLYQTLGKQEKNNLKKQILGLLQQLVLIKKTVFVWDSHNRKLKGTALTLESGI